MSFAFTDRSVLGSKNKLPDGSIMCPARIARAGLQYYAPGELPGVEGWMYRPPEEVFSPQALESFNLATLTINHPKGGVTPNDYKYLSVGAVGDAHQDPKFPGWVSAKVHIVDAQAIRSVQDGKVELSCGYDGDIETIEPRKIKDPVTGEEQLVKYILRNIRGNHVAIVDTARAGAGARLLLDAKPISDFVRKQGNQYEVLSHTGEVLGRHLTRKAALNQLRAIEANKVHDMEKNIETPEVETEEADVEDAKVVVADVKYTAKVCGSDGSEDVLGVFDSIDAAKSAFQKASDEAHPEPVQPVLVETPVVVANIPEIKAEVAKEALVAKGEVIQDASLQDSVTKLQAELARVTSPMFLDGLVKELDQVRAIASKHGVINDSVSANELRRLTVVKSLSLDLASFNDAQVKQIFDAVGTPVEKRVIVDSAPTAVVAIPQDRVAQAILAQHQAALKTS